MRGVIGMGRGGLLGSDFFFFFILYFLFFVGYLCFGGWNGEVYALCENEVNEAVHRLTDNISIYIYLGGSGM